MWRGILADNKYKIRLGTLQELSLIHIFLLSGASPENGREGCVPEYGRRYEPLYPDGHGGCHGEWEKRRKSGFRYGRAADGDDDGAADGEPDGADDGTERFRTAGQFWPARKQRGSEFLSELRNEDERREFLSELWAKADLI